MTKQEFAKSFVVVKGADGKQCKIPPRQFEQLNQAITAINGSGLKYRLIILYGSCARSQARFDSDIDLFVDMDASEIAAQLDVIRRLRNRVLTIYNPDIDIHFGSLETEENNVYKNAIRRDGIALWKN